MNSSIKIKTGNGTYPGVPLRGKKRYTKLYHYTTFETFKLIWYNKKLKFGEIQKVNDINERLKIIDIPFYFFDEIERTRAYIKSGGNIIKSISQEIFSYKQISLTKDYDSYLKGCMSPMMWGHYGDKNNGVCIELDFDKFILPESVYYNEIKYLNVLPYSIHSPNEVQTPSQIEDFVIQHHEQIFFTKTKDWKGENEFRIISKEIDFLDIENALSAIYVTDYNSDVCKKVEEMVNGCVPVQFIYYMPTPQNWRLPILKDTKQFRLQREKDSKDPNNMLNSLF